MQACPTDKSMPEESWKSDEGTVMRSRLLEYAEEKEGIGERGERGGRGVGEEEEEEEEKFALRTTKTHT